jgi:hypothetical protein
MEDGARLRLRFGEIDNDPVSLSRAAKVARGDGIGSPCERRS